MLFRLKVWKFVCEFDYAKTFTNRRWEKSETNPKSLFDAEKEYDFEVYGSEKRLIDRGVQCEKMNNIGGSIQFC